jgi:hypothetical protein
MGKKRKAVIIVSTRVATLKKRLRSHLRSLDFHKTDDGTFTAPGASKDVIRTIHSILKRRSVGGKPRLYLWAFFKPDQILRLRKGHRCSKNLAGPPAKSSNTWESDLFRLAAVQALLRHSDVKTTLQLYAHSVSADRMTAQGEVLEAILGSNATESGLRGFCLLELSALKCGGQGRS